jgi:8-oxo-dGTP pyrophosphatase MutT (NUDIX family)
MPKVCDNKSVGVIIQNPEGELALLKRARFPIGYAPPAGHADLADEHATIEQAALDEVHEEVGLTIAVGGLRKSIIDERRVDNQCRREGGSFHEWTVYEADEYTGDIMPDPDETAGAAWYGYGAVQALADRTKAYRAGQVDQDDWATNPGIEPIWLDFLVELGYVE